MALSNNDTNKKMLKRKRIQKKEWLHILFYTLFGIMSYKLVIGYIT